MKKKYVKYIDYIVNDIELPYLKSLDQYGLKQDEVVMVLSKVYGQPVTIRDNHVTDTNGNCIYRENSNGNWLKYEYDDNGNVIYREDSYGNWIKKEYDANGNRIYYEDNDGNWVKKEYDANGNRIYHETSNGVIRDNR